MAGNFRPGTSMHVILWLAVFAMIALTFMANYVMDLDPNLQEAKRIAERIEADLGVPRASARVTGKRSAPPEDRQYFVTLHLKPEQYDAEERRDLLMKRAFEIVWRESKIVTLTIHVTAKKQAGGGCKPTYVETDKTFFHPHIREPRTRAVKKPAGTKSK